MKATVDAKGLEGTLINTATVHKDKLPEQLKNKYYAIVRATGEEGCIAANGQWQEVGGQTAGKQRTAPDKWSKSSWSASGGGGSVGSKW
jgi:hypothetical protein